MKLRFLFIVSITALLACDNATSNQQEAKDLEVSETPEVNSPLEVYNDCDLDGFESYNEAIRKVRSASFAFEDGISTPESSWISSAEYYSCNGSTGFFILVLENDREYIHAGVPKSIWEGFSHASSKGVYYDATLKGKYRLVLE